MGRHSAGDDDDGVVMTFAAPVAGAPPQRGRHARHDVEMGEPTQSLETPPAGESLAAQDTIQSVLPEPSRAPAEPPAAVPPEAASRPAPAPPAESVQPAQPAQLAHKGHHATAADLALLRTHSDVRARVVAAAVVPFVLYTVVMYLLMAFDVYFIWIWIPLVSAGVLAGSFLDAAHRRLGRQN